MLPLELMGRALILVRLGCGSSFMSKPLPYFLIIIICACSSSALVGPIAVEAACQAP